MAILFAGSIPHRFLRTFPLFSGVGCGCLVTVATLLWKKIMHVLMSIFIGLVVGVVAKLLMPGRDPGGFLMTILLGIGGAELARLIGRAMGLYGPGDVAGFFASVGGAILLLGLYRMFQKTRMDGE